MNISIFDVSGPIMVGPSSSHTAGAVRLARTAAFIAAKPFYRVSFGLHGSFASTYKGHGTDKALVAGAMGFMEDDERIGQAFEIAEEEGLRYDFCETELENVHENTAEISFYFEDGSKCVVVGSSIGGGQILIRKINGTEVEIAAQLPTLLVNQRDEKGVLSKVAGLLAESDINIGTMKLSRKARGSEAFCVIETDEWIQEALLEKIGKIPEVLNVQRINPPKREA